MIIKLASLFNIKYLLHKEGLINNEASLIKKAEFKVTIGEKGLIKSWQAPFKETVKCSCGSDARFACSMFESSKKGDKYICDMYKNNKNSMWPHDRVAIGIYFCKKCLKPIVRFNQA